MLRRCKGAPQPTTRPAGKDRPNEHRGGKASHALIRFLPVGGEGVEFIKRLPLPSYLPVYFHLFILFL